MHCDVDQKWLEVVEWTRGFVEPFGNVWVLGEDCGGELSGMYG